MSVGVYCCRLKNESVYKYGVCIPEPGAPQSVLYVFLFCLTCVCPSGRFLFVKRTVVGFTRSGLCINACVYGMVLRQRGRDSAPPALLLP